MSARILPFPEPDEDWRSPYYLRVVLTKDGQTRLYEIQPGIRVDTVQTWVRWNGQPHRAQLCEGRTMLELIAEEYAREIAALEQDGWTRT